MRANFRRSEVGQARATRSHWGLSAACAGVMVAALAVGACGPSSAREVAEFYDPAVSRRPDAASDAKRETGGPTLENVPTSERDAAVPPADAVGGADVPIPDPAADATPAEKKANGAACSAADECTSGFCADNVCCATACTERCHACNAGATAGQCSPVPSGEDPRESCAAEPVSTCGRDGTCDGAGNCRLHAPDSACEPAGCVDRNRERSARLCDGKGTCLPGTTRACTTTTCENGSCASACTNSEGCLAGHFCDNRVCKLKRLVGQACTDALQCASGACVGGICCDGACDRPCHSCALAGRVGQCLPVPAGQDPGERCNAQAAATCGRDGACDGAGNCRLHAEGTECAAAACDGATVVGSRRCNGRGLCQPGAATSCAPFVCGAGACATTCGGATACAPGFVCSGTTCVPEGLLLRWSFDEATGTTAKDVSGQGHDGAFIGPPTTSVSVPPSKFPNLRSRLFVASARHAAVIVPLPNGLKPAALTLSAFYQVKAIEPGGKGAELISLGNNHLLRLLPTGFEVSKRAKRIGGGAEHQRCFSSPARTDHLDGGWHHLATTIDATHVRIFFDGAEVCVLPSPEPMSYDLTGNLTVGRHGAESGDYDLDGNIDDVRIYGRALSAAEIAGLAAGGF
jgi:Concanavalin A-like lectin/glucanases superfamily